MLKNNALRLKRKTFWVVWNKNTGRFPSLCSASCFYITNACFTSQVGFSGPLSLTSFSQSPVSSQTTSLLVLKSGSGFERTLFGRRVLLHIIQKTFPQSSLLHFAIATDLTIFKKRTFIVQLHLWGGLIQDQEILPQPRVQLVSFGVSRILPATLNQPISNGTDLAIYRDNG